MPLFDGLQKEAQARSWMKKSLIFDDADYLRARAAS